MELTPDSIVYWQAGWFKLNATIAYTWLVMALLGLAAALAKRDMRRHQGAPRRWHNALEAVVLYLRDEIDEVTGGRPAPWLLPLVGSLFLFIALSNALAPVPGYNPPTGSLSTTAALAGIVFFAVPVYGISKGGLRGWLRGYLKPTLLMLPFNVIGDFSRILALAVRLFGNIMSGNMIGAILLLIAPLVVPVLLQLLGLLTGMVHAYIFAVLALVYVAAAAETQDQRHANKETQT